MSSSISTKILIGYLLVGMLGSAIQGNAAPLNDDLCSVRGIQNFLRETDSMEDIKLAYEHCMDDFLSESAIGPAVKRTIDDWIGTDLSKAETHQIFLIYELALGSPKPNNLSADFQWQCRQMVDRFQSYRDVIEPLTARIDVDLDSLLSEGDEEIDEEQRYLLNYVQYAQFCKSLLDESQAED